ncbi:uncharacterized protein BDR25DRAFT_343847 [Lindgomyces ingoldianus]|uniref:Uncharacterized protein n=1 Tax=Lindgomyces ingoldianus TaxID=673940 RepID=A0ACB6QPQ7_9PLEO|nr:uncharacterized protein BDR25DRAFT_343847 [Lindgomyces ingoldianus]KAF2469004.1 hypothetical protein BDR25DRAFT_343847 [Lindgomyces ingoldianus]
MPPIPRVSLLQIISLLDRRGPDDKNPLGRRTCNQVLPNTFEVLAAASGVEQVQGASLKGAWTYRCRCLKFTPRQKEPAACGFLGADADAGTSAGAGAGADEDEDEDENLKTIREILVSISFWSHLKSTVSGAEWKPEGDVSSSRGSTSSL